MHSHKATVCVIRYVWSIGIFNSCITIKCHQTNNNQCGVGVDGEGRASVAKIIGSLEHIIVSVEWHEWHNVVNVGVVVDEDRIIRRSRYTRLFKTGILPSTKSPNPKSMCTSVLPRIIIATRYKLYSLGRYIIHWYAV